MRFLVVIKEGYEGKENLLNYIGDAYEKEFKYEDYEWVYKGYGMFEDDYMNDINFFLEYEFMSKGRSERGLRSVNKGMPLDKVTFDKSQEMFEGIREICNSKEVYIGLMG